MRGAWEDHATAWVVGSHAAGDVESLLAGRAALLRALPRGAQPAQPRAELRLAWTLIGRMRPRVIVTTGAAVAVPFAWVGRVRGVRVVYVETLARAERPSLSCRLVAPIAHRVYVQWPELRRSLPRARYAGTVFSGP